MKTVELKDLIGLHTLSGVETGYMQEKDHESCNYLSFILDGKKYTAFEDPSDGYRSCVERIVVGAGKLKNTIPDTKILAVFARDRYSRLGDLLWFYCVENGELVMEVGTDHHDAYYPCFIGNFRPENLPMNNRKKRNSR